MNRENAIITLTNTASLLRDGTRYMKPEHEKQFREAYEMAIKALEEQPQPSQVARDIATILENEQDMRVILKNGQDIRAVLKNAQSEIIRCKDCKWFEKAGCAVEIVDDSDKPTEDDFCSFAERRTDEWMGNS